MTEVGRMSGQLAGNEAKRQAVVEKMWLHYYNHVLLQFLQHLLHFQNLFLALSHDQYIHLVFFYMPNLC